MHSANDFRARSDQFSWVKRSFLLIGAMLLTTPSPSLFAAVKTAPAPKTDLAAVDASLLDSSVEVEASVKSITKPREGSKAPVRIALADGTGSINLIIWPDVFAVVETQTSLAPGYLVHATVRVSKYRDEIQLTLRAAADIRVLSKPEAAKSSDDTTSPSASTKSLTPLASVNDSLKDQDITIQATISDVRNPTSERAPFIVTLTDGNANIPLVFWTELHDQVKQHIRAGNTIRAKVTVGEHRGTLQVRLRNAQDIESVSTPASATEHKDNNSPADNSTPPSTPDGKVDIARITEEWANRSVTVAGAITASDNIGKGQRLRVRDASGEIQVVLWDSVLAKLPAAELVSGRNITVTGPVKLYGGQVEIVPDHADAVKLSSN